MKKVKQSKKKQVKGFRVDPELQRRLETVSKKLDLPESWFMKNALERIMPEFEEMAKTQAA